MCSMRLFLDAQLLVHLCRVSEKFVELDDLLPVDDPDVWFDLVECSSRWLLGFFFIWLGCHKIWVGFPEGPCMLQLR